MKRKLAAVVTALSAVIATTTAFGQATQVWNGAGDGTNIDLAANYVGGVLPGFANGDTAEFDGVQPGNLFLNYSLGNEAGFAGSSGLNLYLTGNQTGSVTIGNHSSNANPPNFALNGVTIDSGAGAFSWGDDTHLVNYAGRPSGAVHPFINNSANQAFIGGALQMVAGGGAQFTFDFSGTGNWLVDAYLVTYNTPINNTIVQVDGPGMMIWNPVTVPSVNYANSIGGITINGGTLDLVAPHPKLSNQAITDNGIFAFSAPLQSQTLSGVISGIGSLVVSNGTLTLSGASTYTGDTILAGGELIANHSVNVGISGPLGLGTISFGGGTLGFSVNNSFDYSSRISTANNQAYSFDTGGQSVTFATGLSSSGGTLAKLGSGTLTLAGANTYTGVTTVGGGKLVFQGSKSGSANIIVSNGAAIGFVENGSQVTPATLTVGTSSSATLEFNNVNSTTTAPLAAGTISAGGPITVNINSGSFNTIGAVYPLFSWTSGSAPAVTLGLLNGAAGYLSTNGSTINLNITGTPFTWTGLNNGSWDLTTANNWVQSGSAVVFANGLPTVFDDTATVTNITINALVQPANITINTVTNAYNIVSSSGNDIGGAGSLTKIGSGTATLSGGANTYTGATTVSGGTLSVGMLANAGAASDIGSAASFMLNGGTLQYTGNGVMVDRLLTLGTGSGAIDASGTAALILSNAAPVVLSGPGARTLTLTGTDTNGDTFASSLGDNNGATGLNKNGTGSWILTGTNNYSGVTTVASGVLQVGAGGAIGSLGSGTVNDNGQIVFNRTGTLINNGAITGSGSVVNNGAGTVILAGNNTYTGGTTINAGTLQIGNGGATGNIYGGTAITDNGTLIFNTTRSITIGGFNIAINGTGNVIFRAGSFVDASGQNAYTGWTEIDSGATFQPSDGNAGALASSVVTNNGTFFFTRQDSLVFGYTNSIVGTGKVLKENNNQNPGDITLAGTNTYTGGTWIAGGGIVLGDGVNPGFGSIVGSVIFTNTTNPNKNNRYLWFDHPYGDDFTFTNNIVTAVTDGSSAANSGSLVQMGQGTVTLTGNNSYPGSTTVNAGCTLQVGNGGTKGSIGSGAIQTDGTLVYNRSDNITVSNAITGAGGLTQNGSGTLTLTANTTYTGQTTANNGRLIINGLNASSLYAYSNSVVGGIGTFTGFIYMFDHGTTFAPGTPSSIGTLTVSNNYLYISGNMLFKLNKSLTQSNDFVYITNGLPQIAGAGQTLIVTNIGPALKVGDKFYLFNQPLPGAGSVTVTGAGATWQNDLATDGSITALTVPLVNLNPPVMQVSVSGNTLNLAWPTNRYWTLQTNSVGLNAPNQWFPYPGSETITNVSIPINKAVPQVFFRMVYSP